MVEPSPHMATDPRIGSEFAGYRIERILGRGGMGVVYLAEHLRLHRKVALKLLAQELAHDPKFRERFVRESQLAASLEHPNIIPIYDAGELGDELYIAMRYIDGTDLKSLIVNAGRLEAGRVLSILDQAAGALDAAHARGLVHRDVKPGNILLATAPGMKDHAYLSDFGLTKRMTSDSGITGTGQFVGTLDYAAPEQFEGKRLDGRADVYSLGCVLFECLTGEIPYKRDNQAALVYAHLMADPPKVTERRPESQAAIDDVVAMAMAKKPEDRYGTAGALIAEARSAMGPEKLDAVGISRTRAAPRAQSPVTTRAAPDRARRSRMSVLLGAGAAVVVAVVVAAFLLSTGNKGNGGLSTGPSASGAAASMKDRVVRINLANRQVLASIATGDAPSGVTTGEGSVWVANAGGGTVSRIDPVGNKVTGVIRVGKRPVSIAFGEAAIWVANNLSNSVSRIDTATNKVVATIPLEGNPTSIVAGSGSVFVVSALEIVVTEPFPVVNVWRIDPGTNTVTATSRVNGACNGVVAAEEGAAWVSTGQLVARVEPATGDILSEFNPGATIFGMTVGEGFVWAARGGLPARVLRLDAAGKRVEQEIPVGNTRAPGGVGCPSIALETGNGSVWVTNVDDGSISQIAIVSNEAVNTLTVGKGLTDLALGQGGLWVTVDAP
jgi:YVTN family beta-propeller protein